MVGLGRFGFFGASLIVAFALAWTAIGEAPTAAIAQALTPTAQAPTPVVLAPAVQAPTPVSRTPTPAAQPPTPAPSDDPPVWVATHSPTEVWSGAEPDSASFGRVPIGFPFRVVASQEGARLLVYNPLTDNIGWVDAGAVGPIPTPTADQLAAMLAPPLFEKWWAMTHTPAIAWSGPGGDAVAWARIPQWRYLEVLAPEEAGRVLTVDPRNEGYGYVDVLTLGAVGAPPVEYFAAPPPDDETLALPGRVIGTVDRFDRPSRENYFALDRLFHADPVTVRGVVDRGAEGSWYRVGDSAYMPSESVRVPRLPERTFPGRWIDANLSEPVLVTAYEGDRPVYTALAVKGTVAFQTPTGLFRILRRVANETMDSATIGIPRTAPGGYYLRDVLYTQYFTGDGAALHYNYWRSNWGYAGSHGCMGLNLEDSRFLWDFATVGTPIWVHF
jgi:L,D-transpeptidase catalytic domain